MAYEPLLPLESFREILSLNPFHFFQLANGDVPQNSKCATIVREYAWQGSDAVGREDIRKAIYTAEERLREYLRFSVAPRYAEAQLDWLRAWDRSVWPSGVDRDGRWTSVQLPEGQIQALGIEALTLLGTQALTYSDSDSDGLLDTWVATVATTETDIKNLAVYFAAADRYDGDAVGPRWRIQPVRITISGGTATIRGRRWLTVKPILYQGVIQNALDPAAAGNFVTTVEVYTRKTNGDGTTAATAQGLLTWESEPWPWWATCASCGPGTLSTDPAAIATAVARVGLRDAKNGLVIPAEAAYDSTAGTWAATSTSCRPPDRVTIRYLAGWPLDPDGQMSRTWQTVVARLAAAELQRPICGCASANRELYHWQFDLALSVGQNQEEYQLSEQDLNNPLGTRRGQVYAWRQIQNLRNLRGFAL